MQHVKKTSLCLTVITTSLLLLSARVAFAADPAPANKSPAYKGQAETVPAPCPPPLTLKDGFYLGAKGLYDAYSIRGTSRVVAPDFLSSYGYTNPTAANGWGGGIFGGYGIDVAEYFYIGGEVFVNDVSARESNSATLTAPPDSISSNSKVSAGWSWGLSILPGVKLSDVSLAYIRLGYQQTRLLGRQSYTTPLAGGVSASTYTNSMQSGFNYGVGIESAITQNISIRGEANHTSYSTFYNYLSRYNPSDNEYSLGLIYHFTQA